MWTIVAVGLVNAVAAYAIAHLVAPGRAPTVSPVLLVALVLGAVIGVVMAVRGWRDHYRRRRVVS